MCIMSADDGFVAINISSLKIMFMKYIVYISADFAVFTTTVSLFLV